MIALNTLVEARSWPAVMFNVSNISLVLKVKKLFVWFDERFNWEEHVSKLCGNVYGSIPRLWKVAWALEGCTRCYDIHIWLYTNWWTIVSTSWQNQPCIRLANGLKRIDGTRSHAKLILGCTIKNYLDPDVCYMIHELVFTDAIEIKL